MKDKLALTGCISFALGIMLASSYEDANILIWPSILVVVIFIGAWFCMKRPEYAFLVFLFLVKSQQGAGPMSRGKVMRELLVGKGTLLLLGGLVIGLISGKKGHEQYAPLFDTPFRGVLVLFLLEVGMVTGRRIADLRHAGVFLFCFAILLPIL
jgi:hypothetical protein